MNLVIEKSALAAAIALSLCGSARAQTLDPVVVTANRVEIPADEALASVTLLSREDIEKSQSPDLLDLLSRQAGIDIARTGGPGQSSTAFVRGSNPTHTLVLIDGIRVNAATQGVLDFAHLPLAQIERIEIVRGPRAALWGSDAIGGVIHIFTRDPSRAFVEAHLGSYGRAGGTAAIGVARGDSRVGIAVGQDRLQGFSATNDRAYGYDASFDADPDGYRNQNLSLRGQTSLGSQTLGFSGLVTSANVRFDAGFGMPSPSTAALNRVFGVTLAGRLSDRWVHSLSVGRSSEDLDTPAFYSRFGSRRNSLDWINTLALDAENTLNVGLNWSGESGYSDTSFDQSRHNAAAFASWRGRFSAQTLELSLRHDDNSQFGGATTGNAAWGWQAGDALRLRASWGQGFRAPNLNELYYPGFDVGDGVVLFAGNSALQPERSSSLEFGLDWQPSASQNLGLSAYRTRISDLVSFEGEDFRATNINRASIDGVELDYRLVEGGFSLAANATWQDARDGSGARLLRRAPRKANVSVEYRFANRVSVALDASAYSQRPDYAATLAGYARLDLRAAAPLAPGWTVEGRIENLGDRDYSLVDGYNTPGRSGMLNVRWNAQ